MRFLQAVVTLALLAEGAWAQGPGIIRIGSPLRFGGTNAPDTYSDAVTFSSTPVLVDNGRVRIWQEQIPTGSNGEWDVFYMQIVDGGPLAGNINANWSIIIDYTLSANVSFDQTVVQWRRSGVPFAPLSNIGICCPAATNPILPGWAFYNSGFNGVLNAGVQSNWRQVFVDPYSFARSAGVDVSTANELVFGLHFTLRPASGPTISNVISAGAFGAFNSIAPGSWIEIYGSNFAGGTQTWAQGDFDGINAPTRLGGLTVSVGGRPAYVNYVSPTQVNVQVPSGIGIGPQAVVVTTNAGVSPGFTVNVDAVRPGLLAPPTFTISGSQHIVGLFADGVTFALPPGAIGGVTARRPRPGDTIIFYGVGFGNTNPAIAPGQVVQVSNQLSSAFGVSFGGTPAQVTYSGLAPNFVGLYQFNVVVPAIGANDAVPLSFTLGGAALPQNLRIAVGN